MKDRAFFGLFHAALLALFLWTGWRHTGYQVITVDELHPLLTARNLLTDGSLYLSDENLAIYTALYPYWPLPVSRTVGRAYSFRGALPAVPVALLLATARPLTACHNLPAYALMLWLMYRASIRWQVPRERYCWAVLVMTFGSAAAAHWFTFFPYVLVGALLVLLVDAYDRYGATGRWQFLVLAAASMTALLIARQEMIIVACVPLALLTWSHRRQRPARLAAAVLAVALTVGGGTNLLFNYLNAGTWGNIGQGPLRWTTDGLWRWVSEPNENPLLLNPWLLLLCTRQAWRMAWPFLATALCAGGLYSCWWGCGTAATCANWCRRCCWRCRLCSPCA